MTTEVGKDGGCCSPIHGIRKEQGSLCQLHNTSQEIAVDEKEWLLEEILQSDLHCSSFDPCANPFDILIVHIFDYQPERCPSWIKLG